MKAGSVAVGFLDPGMWSQSFGQSLIDLYLADAITSKRIIGPGGTYLRKHASTGGLPEGRNDIAARFLDSTESEWLFVVDSDMGFAPDTVNRLIASADKYHRPVVGALCFALRKDGAIGPLYAQRYAVVPTLYEWVEREDEVGFRPTPEYPRDALVATHGTGSACMIVHRRALGLIRKEYGDHWYDPVTVNGRTFSEDLSFCVRLAKCGLPLFVDTSVKTSHHKGGVFLDESEFDRYCATAAPVEEAMPCANNT